MARYGPNEDENYQSVSNNKILFHLTGTQDRDSKIYCFSLNIQMRYIQD